MEKTLKNIRIVNCTPHSITLLDQEYFVYTQLTPRAKIVFPPSESLARVGYKTRLLEKIITDNIIVDITTTKYSVVKGLPDPQPDTMYIVSKLVAEALYGKREDLLILSGLVRDKNNGILGGRSLAKLTPINSTD